MASAPGSRNAGRHPEAGSACRADLTKLRDIHTPDDEPQGKGQLGNDGRDQEEDAREARGEEQQDLFATYATTATCISKPRIQGR